MDDDAAAVTARWREGLTRSAARAYEAAHGNPIPEQRRGSRWRIEPRVAATVGLVVILLSMVTYWSLRPTTHTPVSLPIAAHTNAATSEVVVHVAGAVNAPGLVTLATGSRVADAIDLAGGMAPTADSSSINLARTVIDGEQIYVPAQGESATSGKVNLNRATASELESLPGIGPVLAARIVADRQANGPYISINDLARVSGVGPSILDQISATATV